MVKRYLESRRRVRNLPANAMSDAMRHLQARQHLGKALIVCEDPAAMLPIAQKQWLKLSRTLQRRRGFTSNAVEILKYTYTITQMQHMQLVAQAPEDAPEALAYFVRPTQLRYVPANTFSVYLTTPLNEEAIGRLVSTLPASGLFVDYTGQVALGDFGLQPKGLLEDRVAAGWQSVEAFLAHNQIDVRRLAYAPGSPAQSDAIDDAVDILLGVDVEFLGIASSFQRTLDLARPLQGISKLQRDRYEMFVLLAHRIQTLSPAGFSPQFLRTYGDDAFFLHDTRRPHETAAEAVMRHRAAGRLRTVQALLRFGESSLGGRSQAVQLMPLVAAL